MSDRPEFDPDLEQMEQSALRSEAQRLRDVIRSHRDAEGDERCHEDDKLLYGVLPEGCPTFKFFTDQEKGILMARCRRFWDTRGYPQNVGRVHEWGQVARQGLYRHYKGKLYLVHGVARHSETGERLVVYRPLYGSFELTVRPETMFIENVDEPEHGHKGPRFEFVSELF